ncbi:MAG: hypothetical protein M3Y53_08490 [Thermoproteota archaeon]|nr:hypothetical protein [Thermoproteota archaeon]
MSTKRKIIFEDSTRLIQTRTGSDEVRPSQCDNKRCRRNAAYFVYLKDLPQWGLNVCRKHSKTITTNDVRGNVENMRAICDIGNKVFSSVFK